MGEQPIDVKQWTKIILILSVLLAVLNGVNPADIMAVGI
tara:strand:+ start:189 stop:305 length:117 start_codon:yes stop_codon:yes gene_type:complete